MAGSHIAGPVGTQPGNEDRIRPITAPPSASFSKPGPVCEPGLTAEEQALALDITQITLDIVGIFEPTPFADGTNALISIGRGDWFGASLSGISIIPYIGDLAKAGKLPRYSQKLSEAIQLARNNVQFARLLRPALERLKKVVDSIPTDISPELADMVNKIKHPLDNYLGMARVSRRLSLTERLVIARLGSVQNVGELVWRNIETAKDYFLRHNVPEDKMFDALNGMDVHSAIDVIQLNKGDKITTYMVLPPGKNVKDLTEAELRSLDPGEWFVKSGGGVGKESVGLAHGVRQPVQFEVQEPMSILKSKAASVDDFWTDGIQRGKGHPAMEAGPGTKRRPHTELEFDPQTMQLKVRSAKDKTTGQQLRGADDKLPSSLGVGTRGGGTQYYLPKSARKSGRSLKALPGAEK